MDAIEGQANLIHGKGRWYLAVTLDVPTLPAEPAAETLGVELGIVNLATDSDGEAFSGGACERTRQRMGALKVALQTRGTKSAKRHLKKLSGREARFRRDTNHCISKRIVRKAKHSHKGIALEDLRHIRSRTERTVKKSQRQRHSSWAFFQLRAFIAYKAALAGVPVRHVNPRDTSRTCSQCGHCEKANRVSQAESLCRSCGFAAPADWNAAINISRAVPSDSLSSRPVDSLENQAIA
jgi:putative transposase